MGRYQNMVRDFHQAMGCQYGWSVKELRVALIEEEAKEVRDAIIAEDPIELLDGLCDLLYVSYGAADLLDIEIHEEISESSYPVIPPAGFQTIKDHVGELESVVIEVSDALRREHKSRVELFLSNLIAGCWRTASEGIGMELAPFFEEVHRTNMLKLGGPVREDGKRLKPPGWKPPRIADMYAKRKGMPVPEDTP